ncbi:BZ3500_MvSof-1268-A1-R1_Chr1-3g01850 [Microbotryum saponariae]|uniref:BZ3500_MvSof-1268-A1-R1_Chr1-3g01850 protein n=1 Tax=Microbotryum saponariae TaxID=289078 RepID=A0A2X0KAG9_9BASI|nr:BZ3500_MvSof-1268-A1-R1_Chr1-3g01850 [Microbotryum saponariae]SCZ94739.1 BZ3501_MvSof-1269-A2-R1_Chr1-3g01452 [Microbotryum saponariae]
MAIVAINRTNEFHEAVRSLGGRYPPPSQASSSKGKAARATPSPHADEAWAKQAEQVASNLKSFASFLHSIRRAYLDLGSTSSSAHHAHHPPRAIDTSKGLAAWEGVKWLNDRERDEIDFGVKVALRKSVDRVRQLEQLEKGRSARVSSKVLLPSRRFTTHFIETLALTVRASHQAKANPNGGLVRMLGLTDTTASSSRTATLESVKSHRAYIILYLNTLLARVSEQQRSQQEARVARQLAKSQTLGGLGGGGALGMDEYGVKLAHQAQGEYNTRIKGKGKELGNNGPGPGQRGGHTAGVPSIYRPAPMPLSASQSAGAMLGIAEDSTDPLSTMLTEDQIQQFEREESALLQATQTDLASLKHAESSLLEISALQTQLATHLSAQSELTDKLYDDAMVVTGKIDDGNVQLKKAKERNRESRVWLLVFLLMASGTLLFLDYYT